MAVHNSQTEQLILVLKGQLNEAENAFRDHEKYSSKLAQILDGEHFTELLVAIEELVSWAPAGHQAIEPLSKLSDVLYDWIFNEGTIRNQAHHEIWTTRAEDTLEKLETLIGKEDLRDLAWLYGKDEPYQVERLVIETINNAVGLAL